MQTNVQCMWQTDFGSCILLQLVLPSYGRVREVIARTVDILR